MNVRGEAPTQQLARGLKNAGFHGLVVRSFAPGTTDADLNIVLWTWGTSLKPSVSDRRRAPTIEIASTFPFFRNTLSDKMKP